jgi:folate-binding Fe-S cluster repair protein YgfZ
MALQYAALRDTVCLEARGADAATFLHAQLSRAVANLDPARAPLAAWADARASARDLARLPGA